MIQLIQSSTDMGTPMRNPNFDSVFFAAVKEHQGEAEFRFTFGAITYIASQKALEGKMFVGAMTAPNGEMYLLYLA